MIVILYPEFILNRHKHQESVLLFRLFNKRFRNKKSRLANDVNVFKKVFSDGNIKLYYKEWMKRDTELRKNFLEQHPIVSRMFKDDAVIKYRESLNMK